jgi:hypothetical protein
MKKRGGSLDNNVWILYIVVVFAFLNLVAFFIAQEWNSAIFFVLVAVVSNAFKLSRTVSLILAMVCTHMFRASNLLREGLENSKDDKKKSHEKQPFVSKEKKKSKEEEPEPHSKKDELHEKAARVLNNNTLEGLTDVTDDLKQRQDQLHQLAGQLEPLMNQASKMLEKLPEGFLQNAFKNKKQ